MDGVPYAENRPLRVIEMPEAYQDAEFLAWVSDMMNDQGALATWFAGGDITQEHADIFMTVETARMTLREWEDLSRDRNSRLGDGSNSDMPPRWFRAICLAVGPGYDGLVWIKNVPDWSSPS